MKRAPVLRAAAGVALAAVVLAACGGGGGGDQATTTSKPTKATTTTAPPPVAPLTGVPDRSGASQTRPVLSVKVENTPEARPQAGIDQADVVWEEVVEGGITRFVAMFNSTSPGVVGPIRSVRLTDPYIVWPVGGIFAYSGGAKYAVDAIKTAPVTLVDESSAGDAMFRDRSRRAPHNLFGRTDGLFAKGGTPVPPPPLFTYASAGKGVTGTPASAVSVGFLGGYAVDWTWDAASRHWLRLIGGQPSTVVGGAQVSTDNVVVMAVPYSGGAGSMGAEAQLLGSGTVWVLRDGKVVTGRWTRGSKQAPAQLTDAAGAPIALVPGRTWVELPDTSYPVRVTAPAPTTTSAP